MSDQTWCEACDKVPTKVVRTILPSIAISRHNVYTLPLSFAMSKQHVIDYKCEQKISVAEYGSEYENKLQVKAGLIGTGDPLTRAYQALTSTIVPGDLSVVRRPGRSTLWSAVTPGGTFGTPNPLARAAAALVDKPERGFRCPEGFQFGGRFTDKYYSTCGKKLFELALSLLTGGQTIAELVSPNIPRGLSVQGRRLQSSATVGQVSMIRKPDINIPKVGSGNFAAFKNAIRNVTDEMTQYAEPVARLVRRDGVVLSPLVSAKVLRTVPDNRDMEGASYVLYVNKPTQIGNEELGMLSNSGIVSIVYVLPNGGTLAIRKTRNLSNGERRRLGRLVAEAEKMPATNDPAARIEYIAAELDGPVAYEQSFGDLKGPNDMITVVDPKTKKEKQVRRWYKDAFLMDSGLRQIAERETQIEDEAGLIDDLKTAISLVNRGGQIGNISPELRIPALEMSKFAESKRVNKKMTSYTVGRDKLIAITPSAANEHLGVMFSSEIQSQLGALAPSVWFAGSGSRRPYIVSYPEDVDSISRIARSTGMDLADPEDMLRIMISDLLSDVRNRNPSGVYTIGSGPARRTFASPVPSAASLSSVGMSKAEILAMMDQSMYRSYFMRLRKEQRKRALALLEELLFRAKQFNFREFARRMAIDGKLSESERRHTDVLRNIFESRIDMLSSSIKFFKDVINGK